MPNQNGKFIAAIVCGLGFGVLAGIAIDARYHPNHITFEVENYTKVNLVPAEGDIIDWVAADPAVGNMQITFHDSAPCKEANGGHHCTVSTENGNGTFVYDCAAALNKDYICFDPGVGPISTTYGGGRVTISDAISDLIEFFTTVKVDFDRLFHAPLKILTRQTSPGTSSATPPDVSGSSPAQGTQPVRAAVMTGIPLTPVIECNNGVTQVDPHEDGLSVNDPIQASGGQIIGWSGAKEFTLTLPTICKEAAKTGNTCTILPGTVGNKYPYGVLLPSCSKTWSTAYITVQ